MPARPAAGIVDAVHAVERLRWVAGARWAPAGEVAAEAAWALAELAEEEPVAVLPACRRLLERHPGCGPLWWVAANVLAAGEPVQAAVDAAERLLGDPTDDALEATLPVEARVVRRGAYSDVAGADLVVVTVDALGPAGVVADGSGAAMLAAAAELGVPAWVVAGVGRLLPARLWGALAGRLDTVPAARRSGPAVVPLHGVTTVVGPQGARPLAAALVAASCPEPAELLGRGGWR